MLNLLVTSLCKQALQDKSQYHTLEQEIYWVQRTQKNWFLLGNEIPDIQYQRLSERDKIIYGKSWMDMEYGLRTKMVSCRCLLLNFAGDFKMDHNVMPHQAISMSRNIFNTNNKWLTREASKLKVSRPDCMHDISIRNVEI